jgi:hypothetical protein
VVLLLQAGHLLGRHISVFSLMVTWGELLGSLVVLVGLGLALGVVDVLAVPRRTAARVPAPTPTARN